VHLLSVDQLNTYDVLVSDDVVFTRGAYEALLARHRVAGATATAAETEAETKAGGETDSSAHGDTQSATASEDEK
jgi:large subunit ribosomal protein L4